MKHKPELSPAFKPVVINPVVEDTGTPESRDDDDDDDEEEEVDAEI